MIDPGQIQPETHKTDDTTLADEYEITRLNALPPELRDLTALHAIDQFESVPSYLGRFSEEK